MSQTLAYKQAYTSQIYIFTDINLRPIEGWRIAVSASWNVVRPWSMLTISVHGDWRGDLVMNLERRWYPVVLARWNLNRDAVLLSEFLAGGGVRD